MRYLLLSLPRSRIGIVNIASQKPATVTFDVTLISQNQLTRGEEVPASFELTRTRKRGGTEHSGYITVGESDCMVTGFEISEVDDGYSMMIYANMSYFGENANGEWDIQSLNLPAMRCRISNTGESEFKLYMYDETGSPTGEERYSAAAGDWIDQVAELDRIVNK